MKKWQLKWIPFIICLFILTSCQPLQNIKAMPAEQGVLDLSKWDFSLDGNVRLKGDWAFYWDQLIEPGQFEESSAKLTGYYDAAGFWTKYAGLNLPSKGFATYHIVIDTADLPQVLSMKSPEIYSEYRLWINGRLMASNGSFNNEKVRYLSPKVYTFYQNGSEIDIVLQVRNVMHKNAGIFESFLLGTPDLINREENKGTALDIIQFAISLFAAVYHFFLFIFRKKDKTLLWFSCFCAALAVRTVFINEDWVTQIYSAITFSTGLRIMIATIPICTISLLAYSWLSYKEETPKRLSYGLLIINGVYLLIVLTTPTYYHSLCYNYYLIAVCLSSFLLLYTAFRVYRKRKSGSGLYLTGLIILAVSAFNDMLYYNQLVSTGFYLSTGLVVFVVIQSILFGQKYARAHREIEKLSFNLKTSLEKIESTETAFLHAQIKPHFLYNSLNTIAECCETDAREAGTLILSLAKYLKGTLDFENLGDYIDLKKELDLVKAYTVIEKARFEDIEVIFDVAENLPSIGMPPLTLQPLVENAIKHGLRKETGRGTVIIKVKFDEDRLLCSVEDDGAGIRVDQMEELLKVPAEGGSIGLYNIHTRLERLYGKGLHIESTYGKGTKVSFEIPYRGSAIC